MKEGDVILTPVPQADGAVKHRPAVVLREMPRYRDLLICGVSTQLRHEVRGFDEIISPSDDDYASSGLMGESLIRLGFLAVTPSKNIAGSIDAISRERHRRLLRNLSDYLVSTSPK